MAGRRTLYLPVMIAVAVAVACSVAFLVLSEEKAKAAFPGKNGRDRLSTAPNQGTTTSTP